MTSQTDSSEPIPFWLHGCSGRMGSKIQEVLDKDQDCGLYLLGGSSRTFEGNTLKHGREVTAEALSMELKSAKLVIDFSSVKAHQLLVSAIEAEEALENKAILIGTTGLGPEVHKRWRDLAKKRKLRVLFAPNTSLGILTTARAAQQIAKQLAGPNRTYDIEICEAHHRDKVDAPSGTAFLLASSIQESLPELETQTARSGKRKANEIGMQAVRGGAVFGEHTIRFIGDEDEIVLTHRVYARDIFARGALDLGKIACKLKPGVHQVSDLDPTLF